VSELIGLSWSVGGCEQIGVIRMQGRTNNVPEKQRDSTTLVDYDISVPRGYQLVAGCIGIYTAVWMRIVEVVLLAC